MNPITPFSLPEALSEGVARATALLPPLIKDTDEVFLRMVFEESIDAFWRMYIDWLPKTAKDGFIVALESSDMEQVFAWQREHANFLDNPQHRAKAEKIVEAIAGKLLSSIAEAYAGWTPEEAAVTVGTWQMQAEELLEEAGVPMKRNQRKQKNQRNQKNQTKQGIQEYSAASSDSSPSSLPS